MTWNDILNNEDHPWIYKSNNVNLKNKDEFLVACELHRCFFDIEEKNFLRFIKFVADMINAKPLKKVGEIGCGNGGLLKALQLKYDIIPYGTDISEPLIKITKKIFPIFKNNFWVGSVINQPVDICLMNSVAAYMPKEHLLKLIYDSKCNKLVLFDIKDKVFEEKTYEIQAKRQGLTLQQRKEKYKKTPLTFYDKDFFNIKSFKTKIFTMPSYFPDSELGAFGVSLER